MDNAFLDLVAKYGGIEFTLGFRDDEDHFLGGTGNKVWYCIVKGSTKECWLGELKGGEWTDTYFLKKKKALTEKSSEPGLALEKICERAYFKQAEIAADGRKPQTTSFYGHECSHYAFSFGARAYDISNEFGVTVSYSNIDDEMAGWRLRNLVTGADVEPPEF